MFGGILINSENMDHARKGFRWIDELLQEIRPFLKNGTDMRNLRCNIIRGYVPHFWRTRLDDLTGKVEKREFRWILSWAADEFAKQDALWKKKEASIVEIGNEFAKVTGTLNDKEVKKVFKNHQWEIDVPVEGISEIDKSGRWKYDACKDRIAVEVELSSRSQIFKDAFKFLIGQAMYQIDLGIIMVREDMVRSGQPYLRLMEKYSHSITTTLPMISLMFYGF